MNVIFAVELYNNETGYWDLIEVFLNKEDAIDYSEDCKSFFETETRMNSYRLYSRIQGTKVDYKDPRPAGIPLKERFKEGNMPNTQGGETWASKSQNPYAYVPEE